MKAILEFNLPEENSEHVLAIKGGDCFFCLLDICDHLRAKIKYDPLTEKEIEIYEQVREECFNIMESRQIDLDMVE